MLCAALLPAWGAGALFNITDSSAPSFALLHLPKLQGWQIKLKNTYNAKDMPYQYQV